VRVDPDHVEALGRLPDDRRGAVVRDPELRGPASGDLLVVARADAGVHPDADPAVVVPLGEAVEGVDRAGGDRQVRLRFGGVDDVVEVAGGRVDRGVMEPRAVEAGRERAVDLAGRGALRVETGVADRFQHGASSVGLDCVPHVGVRERREQAFTVLADPVEVLYVEGRLVFGREVAQAAGVPVARASDRDVLFARFVLVHSRSASSRRVASSVSSSTWVATTAGLYAPPLKRLWSPTDDSTIRVNARRSAGRWP